MQHKGVILKSPFKKTDDVVKAEALQDIKEMSTFMKITDLKRKAVMSMMDQSTTDNSSRENVV